MRLRALKPVLAAVTTAALLVAGLPQGALAADNPTAPGQPGPLATPQRYHTPVPDRREGIRADATRHLKKHQTIVVLPVVPPVSVKGKARIAASGTTERAQAAAASTGSISGSVAGSGTFAQDFPNSVWVDLFSAPVGVQAAYVVAQVKADPVTGAYSFTGLAPATYTLGFYPDNAPAWATTYLGNTAAITRATTVALTEGQSATGINEVIPHAASLSATFNVQGAPSATLDDPFHFQFQPEESCNCSYGTDDRAGSLYPQRNQLHGDGTYTVSFRGLPPGNYSAWIRFSPDLLPNSRQLVHVTGSYQSAVDFQGPFVPVSEGAAVDAGFAGSLLWDPLPAEIFGGSNPSQSLCICQRADPISTQNGELDESATDLTLAGVGPAFAVARSYSSSRSAAGSILGYGWSSLLTSALLSGGTTLSGQPKTIDWVQENGSTVRFYQDSQSPDIYAPNGASHVTLQLDNQTGAWTATRNARDVFTFAPDGTLSATSDLNGNAVSFTRDASGLVTRMSASGGRAFDLTYTAGQLTKIADSASRSVAYSYDAAGNLTGFTDVLGKKTTYGYSSQHQLTTLTKPNGGTTTTSYDASGRVTTQTDALNRSTTVAYTSSTGSLTTRVTGPDGVPVDDTYQGNVLVAVKYPYGVGSGTTYTYDPYLNVSSKTDGNGNKTSYTYDASGNVLSTIDAGGRTTTMTYDALNDQLTSTDALNQKTTQTYDARGNLLSRTSPRGKTQSWTRNADGTAVSQTDGNGKTTTYTYNSRGLLTKATDPLAHASLVGYDAAGRVTSRTDALSRVTAYTVDAAGQQLTATDPLNRVTTQTWDADGNLLTLKDPAGGVTTNGYDLADERTSVQDANGFITTFGYSGVEQHVTSKKDPLGAVTSYTWGYSEKLEIVTDPLNRQTVSTYDGAGNVTSTALPSKKTSTAVFDNTNRRTSTTDAAGKTTTYTYDAVGQKTAETDPLGRVTAYAYDADGNTLSKTYPSGKSETSAYDGVNNVTSFTDADGKVTTYTFDAVGNRLSRTTPGSRLTKYAYDAANQLVTTTNPDASTLTRTYDAAGQVTKVHASQSGSTDVIFVYDLAGRRTSMTDATGTSTKTYDLAGRLTSEKNGAAATTSYAYDKAGRVTGLTYPSSKVVTYAFDAAGQMTGLTDWNAKTTSFTYTTDSGLAKETLGNGLAQSLTYDAVNRVTAMTTLRSSTTVAKYTYGYDAAGELTSDVIMDPSTSASGVAHSYKYDANTQLASSTTSGVATNYAASAAGVLSTFASQTATTDTSGQLTKLTPTSGPALTFAYTANGARSSLTVAANGSTPAATTNYTYAPDQSLATAVLPSSGGTVTYKSDGAGLRQSRVLGSTTTRYTWSTVSDLPQVLDDGTTSYIYGPSGVVVEEVANASQTPQYPVLDLLHSVRFVTNASAASIGTYSYDPYGKAVHTGSAASLLQYTGALMDPSTNLLYLRARDYDPASGQFLVVDPALEQTRQMYAYGRNNPLLNADPSGLDPFALLGAVIGAVTGTVVSVGLYSLEAAATGTFTARGFAGAAAGGFVGGAIGGACYGLSFGTAAFACNAVAGAAGEATSEFISTGSIDVGTVAVAGLVGGAASRAPVLRPLRGARPTRLTNAYAPGINARRMYVNSFTSGVGTGLASGLLSGSLVSSSRVEGSRGQGPC